MEAACQSARNPWQVDACREAGHAGASPVTLPVCDVSDSGVFLSYVMELFLMLLFLYLLL